MIPRNPPRGQVAGGAGIGPVVFYRCSPAEAPHGHELETKLALARAVAELTGRPFAGDFEDGRLYPQRPYFVPSETLVTSLARTLGIDDEHQLFGGVVPQPFVATKAITHPLPDPDAEAPAGWAPAFGQQVSEVVLPGFTAFSPDDAVRAGTRLLRRCAVRLKRPNGVGGRGQAVVRDREQLARTIAALDPIEIRQAGIVLECDLADTRTFSVGQARLAGILVSYCGTQRLTRANDGSQVYGGSDLVVARGDWDRLLTLELAPDVRTAVAQAQVYHEAAIAAFPGLFASRRNYDVVQGVDASGIGRSGVLEQSWRIGGATGAELAALKAFQADAHLTAVHASTTEIYGDATPPGDATVYFRGDDQHAGPITKYARILRHGSP